MPIPLVCFQIESRAPNGNVCPRDENRKCFYGRFVIEVAIIRPGPIQGGHGASLFESGAPAKKAVTYFDERLKTGARTHFGACRLFQEQMLKIAMIMAEFFPGDEAEELRRRAEFFIRSEERMNKGERETARRRWSRKGIAPDKIRQDHSSDPRRSRLYGFSPNRTRSVFAILAYGERISESASRRREFLREPDQQSADGFFYTPATIVKDAQRHGVKIKPVCVKRSDWRCTVFGRQTRFRLGFLCRETELRQEHGRADRGGRAPNDFATASPSGGGPISIARRFSKRAAFSLFEKKKLRTLAELGRVQLFRQASAVSDVESGRADS